MSRTDDKPGTWKVWHDDHLPLTIGVSSCLLGQEVRYDGGHTRDSFLVDQLGPWFDRVPVCPEVELGMGIPRPAIRLEERKGGVHLVAPSTGEDFTSRMTRFARRRVIELQKAGLDGYVLKASSPSCGTGRIRVYGPVGPIRRSGPIRSDEPTRRNGVGFFAGALMERWPTLPIEEEGRLLDPRLRENFVERVFCRNRWRTLVRGGRSRKRLRAFHSAHELLFLAHNQAGYRRMSTLVESAWPIPRLFASYEIELHKVMATHATVKKHVSVLRRAVRQMKNSLDAGEKKEILTTIDDYGAGLLPLVVPLTIFRFVIRRHGIDIFQDQLYFDPHPGELMLRNHV